MKKIAFLLIIVASLTSCVDASDYSPLGSYIKAQNEASRANLESKKEAQHFIDSLKNNRANQVIKNKNR